MKRLKKIFYYFTVVVIAVLSSGALGVYIYKDEIINMLIQEVNKSLKTELEVNSINIDLLKGFPNLAVDFKEVRFHSAFENEMLVTADHVFFILNVPDLLKGEIVIHKLAVEDGKLIVHRNKKGQNNYDVFVNQDSSTAKANSLDIESVQLTHVEIEHIDDPNGLHTTYQIERLNGSAQLLEQDITFYLQSAFSISESSNMAWAEGKKVLITTKAFYHDKVFIIAPSELAINNAHFSFKGEFDKRDVPHVSINIVGEDNEFSSLVSILPDNVQESLAPLNGNGKINFSSNIEGNISKITWPGLEATIQLLDFEINHKLLKEPLHSINVNGKLSIKDLHKLESARFVLEKASARVREQEVHLSGSVSNFETPVISGEMKGEVDVPWLLSVSEASLDEPANGSLTLDVHFKTRLLNEEGAFKIVGPTMEGTCHFNTVNVDFSNFLPLSSLEGSLTLQGGKMELKDFGGQIGQSYFTVNGEVDEFAAFVDAQHRGEMKANLNLVSSNINLDEIVDFIIHLPADSLSERKERAEIPYNFELDMKVDTLKFRRFNGTKLHAKTIVEPRKVTVQQLNSKGFGGQMAVSGSISRQFNNDYFIEATVRSNSIELDSLFYVFDNFSQDFITDKYLKGKLNSEVYAYMYFDQEWRFRRNLLYSEASLQIMEGELNDFEPIMALAPYLNNAEEKLSRLKFSNINSYINISNDTVFLSDMYVGTNVRNIKIGGYHTLDQHIDYRLSVPVINDNKDKDKDFGEVKTDQEGKLYWPFRVKGTTEDYKVSYDLARAGGNIVRGIKKEITEFGKVITGNASKEVKGDTVLLDDEDSFDWDNY